MEDIPLDILRKIFTLCDAHTRLRARAVSKEWHSCASDPEVWGRLDFVPSSSSEPSSTRPHSPYSTYGRNSSASGIDRLTPYALEALRGGLARPARAVTFWGPWEGEGGSSGQVRAGASFKRRSVDSKGPTDKAGARRVARSYMGVSELAIDETVCPLGGLTDDVCEMYARYAKACSRPLPLTQSTAEPGQGSQAQAAARLALSDLAASAAAAALAQVRGAGGASGAVYRGLQVLEISFVPYSRPSELFTDEGLIHMAEACPGLKKLTLRGCTCHVTDRGVLAVGTLCPSLEVFSLWGFSDNVHDWSLAYVVEHCKGLRELHLDRKTTKATDSLASSLAKHAAARLERLSLPMGVSPAAALSLAGDCPRLTTLDVSGCKGLTLSHVEALLSAGLALKSIVLPSDAYDAAEAGLAAAARLRAAASSTSNSNSVALPDSPRSFHTGAAQARLYSTDLIAMRAANANRDFLPLGAAGPGPSDSSACGACAADAPAPAPAAACLWRRQGGTGNLEVAVVLSGVEEGAVVEDDEEEGAVMGRDASSSSCPASASVDIAAQSPGSSSLAGPCQTHPGSPMEGRWAVNDFRPSGAAAACAARAAPVEIKGRAAAWGMGEAGAAAGSAPGPDLSGGLTGIDLSRGARDRGASAAGDALGMGPGNRPRQLSASACPVSVVRGLPLM